MKTPRRTMTLGAGPWAYALTTCFALGALPACSDDGTTTSCPEMPAPTPDDANDDLSDHQEVQEWWEDAWDREDPCATKPLGDGAAGASN